MHPIGTLALDPNPQQVLVAVCGKTVRARARTLMAPEKQAAPAARDPCDHALRPQARLVG